VAPQVSKLGGAGVVSITLSPAHRDERCGTMWGWGLWLAAASCWRFARGPGRRGRI